MKKIKVFTLTSLLAAVMSLLPATAQGGTVLTETSALARPTLLIYR